MAYISQTPPGKGAVLSELPFKARNTLTRLPEAVRLEPSTGSPLGRR